MPPKRSKKSDQPIQAAAIQQIKVKLPCVMLIAAPPEQGKSTLIKYLVYNLSRGGQFHYGWCFSTTAHNGDYDFMPPEYLSATLTPKMIDSIMDYQKSLAAHGPIPPAFLILDDMIGSINPNLPIWSKLFTTYRHYNLTVFATTQYIYKLPPTLRTCCTYAVTFSQFNLKSFNAIYESFMQDFNNVDEVKKYITTNAESGTYRFIMIRNNSGPAGKYTVSKAARVPDFKLEF